MVSLGFTWSHLVSLGITWFHLLSLGLTWFTWFHVVSLAVTCFHMVSFGFTWSHLVSLGLTWYHLVSLGTTWSHLVSHGFAWTHLVSYGFTWSHLVSPGVHMASLGPARCPLRLTEGKGREICEGKRENSVRQKGKGKGHHITFTLDLTRHTGSKAAPRACVRARTNETKRFPGWTHSPNLRFSAIATKKNV